MEAKNNHNRSQDAKDQARFEARIELMMEIDQQHLDLADSYSRLAFSEYEEGFISSAIENYTQAIDLAPKTIKSAAVAHLVPEAKKATLANYYHKRGFCKVRQGEYQLAIEDFTASLAIYPDKLTYRNRGLAYAVLKKPVESRQDLELSESNPPLPARIGPQEMIDRDAERSRLASEYAQHAAAEYEREKIDNALIYCNEAIKVMPKEASYYLLRTKILLRLGNMQQAQLEREKNYLLKHPERAKMQARLSDAKEVKSTQVLSQELLRHIGSFGTVDIVNSMAQASVRNLVDFDSMLEIELQKKWETIQKDFTLGDITPKQLLVVLKENPAKRIEIFQKAIQIRAFSFVHYLIMQGIDINEPWVETYTTTRTITRHMRIHGEVVGESNETVSDTHELRHHALDELMKESPLNTPSFLALFSMGVAFGIKDINSVIFPGILAMLSRPLSYPAEHVRAARELFTKIIRNMNPEDIVMNDDDLRIIVKAAKSMPDPYVRRLEVYFLMRQLKTLIPHFPHSLNIFADRQDLPLINQTIEKLERIAKLKTVTPQDIANFEQAKRDLYQQAKLPAGAKPRDLLKLLEELKRNELFTLSPKPAEVKSLPAAAPPAAPQPRAEAKQRQPSDDKQLVAGFARLHSAGPSASPKDEHKKPENAVQDLIKKIETDLADLAQSKPDLSKELSQEFQQVKQQCVAQNKVEPLLKFRERISEHLVAVAGSQPS